MRINPDNKKIRYSGRIDWRNPKEPIWVYPCTSAEFKFTGKYLKIFLKNKNEYWQNYLGCILFFCAETKILSINCYNFVVFISTCV